MAQDKKNYTNADIIRRLDVLDGRLQAIEVWKISQEAGRQAVDEYRRQESSDKMNKGRQSVFDSIKDMTPYAIAVLVALASLIYAVASRSSK